MPERIDAGSPEALGEYLTALGWLPEGAILTAVTRAGEGNMNRVLRVRWTTADGQPGSAIAKQSAPFVEKFPDIPAPADRILVEADFYRLVADTPAVAGSMPKLIALDRAARLAWLEDLGEASDYSNQYESSTLAQRDLDRLLKWLSALHTLKVNGDVWPRLRNRDMRALNHAHIFEIPFDPETGPDVDAHCPGLQRIADGLRADAALREAALALGREYLEDGPTLLHGDFYPGSWLATSRGPCVIDPEFGFLGRAEFDIGVLRAHLAFMGAEDLSMGAYRPPRYFDGALAFGFTGVELLRRLLGVAQLPLNADLDQRRRWLETARTAVLAAAG